MGQNSSKTYNDEHFIPAERLFKLSYTVKTPQRNVCNIVQTVNLSLLLNEYTNIGVFMQFLYQKLKYAGYNSLKPINVDFGYTSIQSILQDLNENGIPVGNGVIKDVKIIKNCYEPNFNNICYFLNKGRLLLAMIILDTEFITESLKLTENNLKEVATDAVVIVGYDEFNFYIKTNWFKFIVKVENKFINNIKEIWDIDILTFNNY